MLIIHTLLAVSCTFVRYNMRYFGSASFGHPFLGKERSLTYYVLVSDSGGGETMSCKGDFRDVATSRQRKRAFFALDIIINIVRRLHFYSGFHAGRLQHLRCGGGHRGSGRRC